MKNQIWLGCFTVFEGVKEEVGSFHKHLIYLSSPYSHEDKKIEDQRFLATERATAIALQTGLNIFSPIVHCHTIARKYGLPTDAEFWKKYNSAFLLKCTHLAILTLPGWTESIGVNWEKKFIMPHQPILYVEYQDAPSTQA